MIEEGHSDDRPLTKWQRHRFLVLIGAVIVVALFLVGVALALYASSGAAQLDLSRPGYVSVRDQANKEADFDSFPATGQITEQTIDQFRSAFEKQAQKATGIDSFGGNAMSDQALSLDGPAAP